MLSGSIWCAGYAAPSIRTKCQTSRNRRSCQPRLIALECVVLFRITVWSQAATMKEFPNAFSLRSVSTTGRTVTQAYRKDTFSMNDGYGQRGRSIASTFLYCCPSDMERRAEKKKIGRTPLPVKLYAAVQDADIHFHVLQSETNP